MEIRVATTADRERVFALLRAQLDDHSVRPSDAALRAAIDGVLRQADLGWVLVAILEGEIVGVAAVANSWSFENGGKLAWLDDLYVEPAHRGRGIGAALVRAACERAAAEGAKVMELEVEAGHERAAALYAREGFVSLDRRPWVRPLKPND